MSIPDGEKYFWSSTVLVLLGENDHEIINIIQEWAKANNYKVFIGSENSHDAFMMSGFINIIDRNLLDDKLYKEFLYYTSYSGKFYDADEKVKHGNAWIFYDDIRDREYPATDLVIQISKKYVSTTNFILNILNYVSNLLKSN